MLGRWDRLAKDGDFSAWRYSRRRYAVDLGGSTYEMFVSGTAQTEAGTHRWPVDEVR